MQALNAKFWEVFQLASGVPLDTQGASGLATPYVSLKGWAKATVIYIGAAGTGTDAAVINFLQATTVTATGEKALTVTSFAAKSGADLKTVGQFTAVSQAAGTVTGGVATEQKCVVVDILPSDLDVDGGFDCLKAAVADTGAAGAQLGVLFILLWGPRYAGGGAAPSALGN